MARQGKTLFILKNHYGNDGYAFWFQLLELLCISENHYYDCREEHSWQYILAQTGVKEATGIEILGLLAKLGNIDLKMWGHRIIWCPNLVNNLEDVYKKRGRPAPDKPSCELITVPEKPITAPEKSLSGTEIPQSKVKESILNKSIKESKENPSSNNKTVTLQDVIATYQENINQDDTISKDIQEELRIVCQRFPPAWVVDAIKEAASQKTPRWVRLTSVGNILNNWGKFGKADSR